MVSAGVSIVLLVIIGGLRRHDLLLTFVHDLLNLIDPLTVAMVLFVPMALEEGLHPAVHLVLHVVILGLYEVNVCLVEVCAGREHLLTVPKVPRLPLVVLSEVLILGREGLHLTLCSF